MKPAQILLTVLLSAAVAFAVGRYAPTPSAQNETKKETAFERVMRTNTLRCGYYTYVPITVKDPNTGNLSGFSIDMMDYFTQKTGIKVVWAEEITFGNWLPALQSGRFDAVCTPLWPDLSFYRAAKFTRPIMFTDMIPIVRADEQRFSHDLSLFNDEQFTIGAMEGDSSLSIVRTFFPKAKIAAVPASSDYAILLQNLIDKKIDMVPWERNSIYQFNLKNPGLIKPLPVKEPIALMPSKLVVSSGETDLADLLNALIEEMQSNGMFKKIERQWLTVPGIVLNSAKPYDPESYTPFVLPQAKQVTP